jgi:hypothetical protein
MPARDAAAAANGQTACPVLEGERTYGRHREIDAIDPKRKCATLIERVYRPVSGTLRPIGRAMYRRDRLADSGLARPDTGNVSFRRLQHKDLGLPRAVGKEEVKDQGLTLFDLSVVKVQSILGPIGYLDVAEGVGSHRWTGAPILSQGKTIAVGAGPRRYFARFYPESIPCGPTMVDHHLNYRHTYRISCANPVIEAPARKSDDQHRLQAGDIFDHDKRIGEAARTRDPTDGKVASLITESNALNSHRSRSGRRGGQKKIGQQGYH